MNRSAMCIRMLQMLKSRGMMTKEELALELHTNLRNISEYRKELESAGYRILWTTGKYGGYLLQDSVLLPPLGLSEAEKASLRELQTYLHSHRDFVGTQSVNGVIDRMLSNTRLNNEPLGLYIEQEQGLLSDQLHQYIDTIKHAIKNCICVELKYRSIRDKKVKTFIIHPYELIHYKGAYYCIAYSIKAKDYRTYKFSEERMKHCALKENHFNRDRDFELSDHVGTVGLIKQEMIQVTFLAYEEAAIYMAERHIGLNPEFTWENAETLRYTTIFEGKKEAISFLLSLGAKTKLIAPNSLKEEVKEEIQKMCKNYV